MVCEWGMSDTLGPIAWGKHDSEPFLGRDIQRPQNYSEATAQAIDREVREIIMTQYGRAKEILTTNFAALERLAGALIEREALSADEVDAAVEGRPLPPLEEVRPAVKPATAKPEEKKVRPAIPVAEPT
jgi:cell division protease FtsH